MVYQTNKIVKFCFCLERLISSWEINPLSRNYFSWPQATQGIDEMKRMSYSFSLYYLQF